MPTTVTNRMVGPTPAWQRLDWVAKSILVAMYAAQQAGPAAADIAKDLERIYQDASRRRDRA